MCSNDAEVRLYDHLFTKENPDDVEDGQDFTANINADSLTVLADCKAEPAVAEMKPLDRCQFERLGYFCMDPDSTAEKLVFNKTVGLRDTWAKIQKQKK